MCDDRGSVLKSKSLLMDENTQKIEFEHSVDVISHVIVDAMHEC